MTAGSLFSNLVLLLRNGSCEKSWLKMPLFILMQPVQSCEDNEIVIFLKNVMTNTFLSILHRLHKKIYQFSPFSQEEKYAYIISSPHRWHLLACGEIFRTLLREKTLFAALYKNCHVRPFNFTGRVDFAYRRSCTETDLQSTGLPCLVISLVWTLDWCSYWPCSS